MKMECKKCKTETERYADGRCKPCVQATNAAWAKANAARRNETHAVWAAAKRDKLKAASAAWYAANQERAKATRAAWRAANPEVCRIHRHNRRASERSVGGKLSKGITAKLLKLQRGLCPCCKQPLGDDYHLDHIIPIALGGSNIDSNIQLLRQRCNSQKHAAHPVDFMQSRGFLL